jgi:hypothetical protein
MPLSTDSTPMKRGGYPILIWGSSVVLQDLLGLQDLRLAQFFFDAPHMRRVHHNAVFDASPRL